MKKKCLLVALAPLLLAAACSDSKAPAPASTGGGADSGSAESPTGAFLPLEEALGDLSDDDLLNICYRNNGNHLYDDEGHEIDVPAEKIKTIAPLDEGAAATMIDDYFLSIRDQPEYQADGIEKKRVSIAVYCGQYEGYHALRFADLLMLPAVTCVKKTGGYNFHYPYEGGNEVVLWRAAD